MWYEVLPSAFLSGGLLCIPYLAMPYINDFLYGCPTHKKFDNAFARRMLLRDQRIKGDFYKQSSLDEVPSN